MCVFSFLTIVVREGEKGGKKRGEKEVERKRGEKKNLLLFCHCCQRKRRGKINGRGGATKHTWNNNCFC